MATTTINASPSQQYILYSESADRYFVSTVSWTKPDAGYTMQSLQLAFSTDYNGGYRVMTNHQVSDGWVIVGTYETYENAGDKLITLPSSYWQNLSSDTLYLRFRRPTNGRQTYNNIRLIMTYTANASASTAAAVDAIAGTPQTVNISNTDSTVTHAVTWQYGSLSGSTFTSLVSSGAQTYGAATRSPAWAVPTASLATLYAANGSRTTIPGRITVETFLEGNSLGSTTLEALLTIPNDNTTKPTLTVATNADQDSVATASGEDWLQNHTTLEITPTAAAQAGASVASIRIETPDGVIAATSGTATRILIRTAGSYPVTVIVTDSRGYTNVWATTLTVAECAAPVITGIMAERCAQDGTRTDEGAYVAISATARITSIAAVSSWTYSIKKSGSSAVIASGSLTNGAGIIGGSLDSESTYTVEVTVTDSLGQSATASTDIGSAIYTIHRMAGGKGIAFGKVSDKYGVEVNEDWPLYAHGMEIMQLVVDAAHPVGSVIQTADANWNPNEAWPWTSWVLLKDVFLRASGSQQALATGGAASASIAQQTLNIPEQSVTLTPENMPIYTVYARLSNGSSVNYNGYETDPVTSMIYRAHTPGSNSGTASDWRYLISSQDAAAVSIPAQSATIPAQSVATLPPYLVVNTWLRVANVNDSAANNVLSGILGGLSMTGSGSGSGEGGYSGLMAVFARNIGEMEGEFERNDEEHTAIQGQFENCVKYGDLTEEYSASVIGGRMNGPNLIITQVFWTTNQYNQIVVLGDAARHTWSGHPWVKSIVRDKEYTYDTEPSDKGDSYWVTTDDQGVTTYHVYKDEDEVRTSRVNLGASPVVEPSGESYQYALQFAVTAAATGAHNSEDLIFYTGSDGGTSTREVDDGNGGTTTETYTYPASGILDLVDGETYTASCWVRITSGTQARLVFKYGHSYSGNVSGYEGENQNSMEITSAEYGTWKRLEWTFVYHSTDHAGNAGGWKKRVSFGVCRKYTGTVQMCGWRVVHGLNSWLEEQNRQIQAGISALEARVQALEG